MPDKITTGERRALRTLPPIARDLIIAALAIAVSISGFMFTRAVDQFELLQSDIISLRLDWARHTERMTQAERRLDRIETSPHTR